MNMTLGQRLRELRLKNDLSLRELGNQVGKTAAFLSDVELGQRFPGEDLLKVLAKTTKTTVADLTRYDQRPPTREIQDLATFNPQFGFAFRRALDVIKEQNLSPEAFVKRIEGDKKDSKGE